MLQCDSDYHIGAVAVMERKKHYNTRQKEYILEFFKKHKGECFSAKQLICEKDFHMGEATVYRLLVKLSDDGCLRKFISANDSGAVYQYNNAEQCDEHFHLKCLSCGEAICVDCSYLSGMEKHVENEHAFLVDNTKTVIYGTCKLCSASHGTNN